MPNATDSCTSMYTTTMNQSQQLGNETNLQVLSPASDFFWQPKSSFLGNGNFSLGRVRRKAALDKESRDKGKEGLALKQMGANNGEITMRQTCTSQTLRRLRQDLFPAQANMLVQETAWASQQDAILKKKQYNRGKGVTKWLALA